MSPSKVFLEAAMRCEREFPSTAGYAPFYVGNASREFDGAYCGKAHKMLTGYGLDNLYGDEAILGICFMAAITASGR
jgi:hypothetical protein